MIRYRRETYLMLRNMTDARLRLLIAIGLVVITVAAYLPVFGNQFVDYDDNRYVYDNPRVMDGISLKNLSWAFTSIWNSNWHPLTWISHMLDCQMYGLNPMGHHVTSLLLHLANTLLLFLLLVRLTGSTWRSAFVAALFAIHPLHVESVAWVAERKDVLSTFFFMLTLLAYVRYAESPNTKRYLLMTGAYVLGLMAKPMLVTIPIVLLLLDYWPLGRFRQTIKARKKQPASNPTMKLLLEKTPLFVLALGSSVITLIAQRAGGAVNPLEHLPLGERVSTALAGYAAYIWQTVWPLRLGVIYPHPFDSLPTWQVIVSIVLLAAISFLVYRARSDRPYLTFGWLWFVITLVPVIGLVQVGVQFIADRYTYIPLIGLFVAAAWGVAEWCGSMGVWGCGSERNAPTRPHSHTPTLPIAAVIVLVSLCFLTFRQVGYWKDGYTLFTHTLEVTKPSATAHTNLGIILAARGKLDDAIAHYKEALEISPGHANALFNLGNALIKKKMYNEAIEVYQQAVEQYQHASGDVSVDAHTNLANAYSQMRMYEEAEAEYQQALAADPSYLPAITNLGNMMKETGRLDEAEELYRRAIAIRPKDPESHSNLGVALAGQARIDEAVEEFDRALALDPKNTGALVNLANVHASRKDYGKAIEEYRRAISIKSDLPEAHHNLGLVLKTQGDLRGAIAEFRKAVDIDPSMPVPHVSLATALFEAGDYPGAWREVHACEAVRGRPPKTLVDQLSAKMPDPGP